MIAKLLILKNNSDNLYNQIDIYFISANENYIFTSIIIADILRNPIFPIQEQKRIKDDLLRNLDLIQVDPQALTSVRLNYLIFQDHPYGREFPQKNNLKKFSHSILKSFYKNAIDSTKTKVYVIGNFDINQIDNQLENSFGDWRSNICFVADDIDDDSWEFRLQENIDAIVARTKTINAPVTVSFFVGQVTLNASCFTS